MNLHSAPPPFGEWAPPTRFAAARDLAILVLCILLIAGFLAQIWSATPRPADPVSALFVACAQA